MINKHRLSLSLCMVACACAGGGSDNERPAESQPKAPTDTIEVAQFGDLLLYTPLYIAQSEGFFAKQGLEVKIVSTGGDDKTYAAVLSGSAMFGIADPTFVAVARERGQQGVVLGLVVDGMPNYGVATDPRVGMIRTARDIISYRVASVPAPSTSYLLTNDLFQQARSSPRIVQVAPSGLTSAIESHRADIAVLIEPYVSQLEASGARVVLNLQKFYPQFALTGVTATAELVRNRPDFAKRFLAAMAEGVKVFYSDSTASVRAATKRFPDTEVATLARALARHRNDRIHPLGLCLSPASWELAIAMRRRAGDLERKPLAWTDYADTTFTDPSCRAK